MKSLTPLLGLIVLVTACQSTAVRRIDEELEKDPVPVVGSAAEGATGTPIPATFGETVGRGPKFLAFPRRDDAVVASIGNESLTKSQIFDYLLTTYPQEVRASVAVMLGNRILATEVEKHGIEISSREIDDWIVSHRAALKRQAEVDLGPGASFEQWLKLSYGQTVSDYEIAARDRERAKRLLSRTIRYHGILEDTVELRIISVGDRKLAADLRSQLAQGADFGILAERYSLHATAERGGRMFPLWRPAVNDSLAGPAFELPVGAVSNAIQVRDRAGKERWQIIKIVNRLPGRSIPYAEVKDEIEAGLRVRPLTEEEWYMWQVKTERMARISLPGL